MKYEIYTIAEGKGWVLLFYINPFAWKIGKGVSGTNYILTVYSFGPFDLLVFRWED